MQQCQSGNAIGARDGLGEEDGVFVGEDVEIGVALSGKVDQPVARPGVEITGTGKGDARAGTPQRRIGHHVAVGMGQVGHAGILTAAPIRLDALVRGLWLQGHTQAFHVDRAAMPIALHPRDPDARVVVGGHQAWEEVVGAVGAFDTRGIEYALHLIWIVGLGRHNHAEPLYAERQG